MGGILEKGKALNDFGRKKGSLIENPIGPEKGFRRKHINKETD